MQGMRKNAKWKTVLPAALILTLMFAFAAFGAEEALSLIHILARGAMVRYMAENQVTAPEQIKNFDWMGYRYIENLSDSSVWVFAAEKKTKRKS